MWHWRESQDYRKRAREIRHAIENLKNADMHSVFIEGLRNNADTYDRLADSHIKAVQLLNDIPDLQGTTAEQDCASCLKH
jgi:uridine kinase